MSAMAVTATSPKEWKSQDARKYVVLSLQHSADSLVCRPCRDDIARVLADPAYIPRWRKGRVEGCSSYCSVKDCNSISFTQTSLCSNIDDLKISLGIEFTTECIPIPTFLCKNHYHVLYDALQLRRKHCIIVVDVCVQGMIGPAHNHISFKYIYPKTQTFWVIFLRMIVYA